MNVYILSMITLAFITLIGVIGVFLLTGLLGLFSFGQAAFMAIGAYTAGLVVIKLKLPFGLAIVFGVVMGILFALIIGYPTLKLRKDYFALVTLVFGQAIAALLNYFVGLTGGASGLSGIPKKTDFWLVAVSLVVIIFFVANLKRTKFGRICVAIKNDELAAQSFGIDVFAVKLKVFVLSAALTAYAGALYGFFVTYVEPIMFGWMKSAEWVIIVFFGGAASLTGAIFSGLLLTILPEVLRFASEYRIALYSVLILIVLNFKPKGLLNETELSLNLFKRMFSKGTAK